MQKTCPMCMSLQTRHYGNLTSLISDNTLFKCGLVFQVLQNHLLKFIIHIF